MEKWSKDSLVFQRRGGTPDSPYIDITEALKVDGNCSVTLREIPSRYHGVSVTSRTKVWHEVEDGIENETEYMVDYESGRVTFHKSNEDKLLNFTYKGTGQTFTPANRIYTVRKGQTILETLEDVALRGSLQADLVDAILKEGQVASINGKTGIIDDIAELSDILMLEEDFNKKINKSLKTISDKQNIVHDGFVTNTENMLELEDVVPYFMDMTKLGDTSEETINRLYEQMEAQHIYELYDALVTDNTKTRKVFNWGNDSDGNPLKWYHFEPEMKYKIPTSNTGEDTFDMFNRLRGSKPLLFIVSGVHGNEKTNMYALYKTIQHILEGKDPMDRYIRANYEIVVLPCVNPYGINNNRRNNENNVNINRNFPYTWEQDESSDKGSKPFSEKGTQFIRDVRNQFLEDINYRQGILFIDSHDFNWTNYTNDRVLWSGANRTDVRQTLIKVGNVVEKKLTEMYPNLITGENQTFFHLGSSGTGYGSTLNAWNNNDGIKAFSMECPNNITILGVNTKYSLESAQIGYFIVSDFIKQTTSKLVGVDPLDRIVGFKDMMANADMELLDILHAIPSGRDFVQGVYSNNSNFSSKMPRQPSGSIYTGVFKATKSDASTSSSGIMEFTTTTQTPTRKFYASFNKDGVSDWVEHATTPIKNSFDTLHLDREKAKITDVFNNMNVGDVAELYITPLTKGIHSQLPSNFATNYGFLRVVKYAGSTGMIEVTNSSASRNRRFINNINTSGMTTWTEILTEAVD